MSHINGHSWDERQAVPIALHKVTLPTTPIPLGTDYVAIGERFTQRLPSLQATDFTGDAYWRDLLSLTGTFRSLHGSTRIAAAWTKLVDEYAASGFTLEQKRTSVDRNMVIRVGFAFRTLLGGRLQTLCSGYIRIVLDSAKEWKIWVLTTWIERVEGWPDPDVLEQRTVHSTPALSNGFVNGINHDGRHSAPTSKVDFDSVVVGCNMAGLCILGRLKVLGVSAIGIERNAKVGDGWTNRYKSLKLHTPKEYSQLPLGRWFDEEHSYYPTAEEVAEVYRTFADACELNIRCSSNVTSATWQESTRTWRVLMTAGGEQREIIARHVVFAIGGTGQVPKAPVLPDRDDFRGTTMHSIEWKSGAQWTGGKGVVIGSGTTAHDVVFDMAQAGLKEVTMIQRSPTAYMLEEYARVFFDPLYNKDSDIDASDRLSYTTPSPVARAQSLVGVRTLADQTPERFDCLERVGMKVNRYPDLQHHFFELQGGHYVDNGTASPLIANGRIKVKSDALPDRFAANGLHMTDGSLLEADVVVFCTGFETNMRLAVAKIVGSEVADQIEDNSEFDADGELRGTWKALGHPAIWYAGGTTPTARFFSRFLALQIKADVEGVPFVPYLD